MNSWHGPPLTLWQNEPKWLVQSGVDWVDWDLFLSQSHVSTLVSLGTGFSSDVWSLCASDSKRTALPCLDCTGCCRVGPTHQQSSIYLCRETLSVSAPPRCASSCPAVSWRIVLNFISTFQSLDDASCRRSSHFTFEEKSNMNHHWAMGLYL